MPATARQEQVDLDVTPFYHCTSQCVRQAYLAGIDKRTGKDYSHRKEWFAERLAFLVEIFAIDVCSYAMMSTHFHVALRVALARALAWSDAEVIERHRRLYPSATARGLKLPPSAVAAKVKMWRKRLSSISAFMQALKQWFSDRANAEDKCKGRFWAGRFGCQPLLDHSAVLGVMVYVDLNPVRAGITDRIEESDHTAIQQRLIEMARAAVQPADGTNAKLAATVHGENDDDEGPAKRPRLMRFAPPGYIAHPANDLDADAVLPITFADYVNLVRWTGQAVRPGCGTLGPVPNSLAELASNAAAWVDAHRKGTLGKPAALGSATSLQAYAAGRGRGWVRGQRDLAKVFAS